MKRIFNSDYISIYKEYDVPCNLSESEVQKMQACAIKEEMNVRGNTENNYNAITSLNMANGILTIYLVDFRTPFYTMISNYLIMCEQINSIYTSCIKFMIREFKKSSNQNNSEGIKKISEEIVNIYLQNYADSEDFASNSIMDFSISAYLEAINSMRDEEIINEKTFEEVLEIFNEATKEMDINFGVKNPEEESPEKEEITGLSNKLYDSKGPIYLGGDIRDIIELAKNDIVHGDILRTPEGEYLLRAYDVQNQCFIHEHLFETQKPDTFKVLNRI